MFFKATLSPVPFIVFNSEINPGCDKIRLSDIEDVQTNLGSEGLTSEEATWPGVAVLYQLSYQAIWELVEHCTGIAEVMSSNFVQDWIFFKALVAASPCWSRN